MRLLEFSGSARTMGQAFGETCRAEIIELYALRLENALEQARTYGGRESVGEADLLRIAGKSLEIIQREAPEGYQELFGIAEGANSSIESVWAMNALTDLRDVLAFGKEDEGCSSFLSSQGGQAFCGQTWDLATDNMPFVLMVRRKPDVGPPTLCLTLTGCLSLIGMNAHGVAVGTTNIRTTDGRPGMGYLDLIHLALSRSDLDKAMEALECSSRAGAHYYYLMDETGQAYAVECSATLYCVLEIEKESFVHCNHIVAAEMRDLEADTPAFSSHFRQPRLQELLSSCSTVDVDALKTFLADHAGEENAICRHDSSGISTNGVVIMEPAERALWAVHGQACKNPWHRYEVES